MSAPVTKEHCALWNKLYNLAFNECFGGDSSDAQAAQLIADSEAKALDELKKRADHWCDMHTVCAKERDQLRAELDAVEEWKKWHGDPAKDVAELTARAERAELRVKQLEESK